MNVLSHLRRIFNRRDKTTATMANIAGLSEQQCAAIQGVQVGDLIFVQKVVAPTYNQDDLESGDEDEEDGGAESGDEDEEDGSAGSGDEQDIDELDYDEQDGDEQDENDDDSDDENGDSASVMDEDTSEGEPVNESTDQDTTNGWSTTSISDTDVPPRMYVVSHITADANGSIIDVQLSHLHYAHKISDDTTGHTYQIHGKKVIHQHPAACGQDCVNAARIIDIAIDENFHLTIKPTGDVVRYTDSTFRTANPYTRCIASCVDGWLQSMQGLGDMITDYDPPVLSTGLQLPPSLQPTVCPVCIGDELCKKQQELQATFMLTAMADVGDIVEFLGQLNQRRRNELGYSFTQFDEREWGMHFDDMQSGDGSEAGDNGDRYQQWDEAMDPSSVSVVNRPASATTIAALPRKSSADTPLPKGTECQVCKDDLEEESVLVELPCGHVHFHEDCIATWLRQFNTCPDCRKEVPAVAEPEDPSEEVMDGEIQDDDAILSDE